MCTGLQNKNTGLGYSKETGRMGGGGRWRATKMLKGLGYMSCEEKLRTFGLSSPKKRKLRGDIMALCSP